MRYIIIYMLYHYICFASCHSWQLQIMNYFPNCLSLTKGMTPVPAVHTRWSPLYLEAN